MGDGGGAAGEGEVTLVGCSGEVAFFFSGGDFPGGGGVGGVEEEGDGRAVEVDLDILDALEVGAVEGIGEAEEGGEMADPVLVGGGKSFEVGMFVGGQGFAVIAGDLGDAFHLEGGEVGPVLLTDDAGGMFVMSGAAVAGGPTDIMEEGGAFEEGAVVEGELVEGLQLVEEADGNFGDMDGMFRFGFEPGERLVEISKNSGVIHVDASSDGGPTVDGSNPGRE